MLTDQLDSRGHYNAPVCLCSSMKRVEENAVGSNILHAWNMPATLLSVSRWHRPNSGLNAPTDCSRLLGLSDPSDVVELVCKLV